MLSDRFRWIKIGALLITAIGLGALHAHRSLTSEVGYHRCMTDPVNFDGYTIYLALWSVSSVAPGGYTVEKYNRQVPVLGDPALSSAGDTVSVIGHFDAGQEAVIQEELEIHHLRKIKAGLGGLGVLLTIGYALWAFRIRDRRLVLKEWDDA